ncbi:enoyl-CoA hydratase [Advenella kashmirensis W13003]|uniref:Enoyl-CoA hydratase n=1 Tax=Advenella kashmirensis W13003 TaxID=1424334 RepID=V8QXU1_9BURK|nr:crotonase/enoyl-CoA hydratase family protein [Advenella kashmirensis]ETF04462.1 enoyl-CoA hydratase [Advenella kashmirensis W13003]
MSFVEISIDERVALLTLNDPDQRNALSGPEQFEALVASCERISNDKNIHCVVLTGAGSAFCAGGNVKNMWQRICDPNAVAADQRYRYKEGIHRVVHALHGLEVPTIAAINGPAVGAGLDLACMCDIRIASTKASFAESFVKLGIIPGDGGAWLLQKIVGPSRAAELIFTGDKIGPEQALSYGLISRIVEHDDLLKEATALARRIAANPPYAVRMAKRLLRESQHSRLESVLEMSAAFQALAHFTPDHRELVETAANRSAR